MIYFGKSFELNKDNIAITLKVNNKMFLKIISHFLQKKITIFNMCVTMRR